MISNFPESLFVFGFQEGATLANLTGSPCWTLIHSVTTWSHGTEERNLELVLKVMGYHCSPAIGSQPAINTTGAPQLTPSAYLPLSVSFWPPALHSFWHPSWSLPSSFFRCWPRMSGPLWGSSQQHEAFFPRLHTIDSLQNWRRKSRMARSYLV